MSIHLSKLNLKKYLNIKSHQTQTLNSLYFLHWWDKVPDTRKIKGREVYFSSCFSPQWYGFKARQGTAQEHGRAVDKKQRVEGGAGKGGKQSV